MTRSLKQKLSFTLAAATLIAALGAGCGYLIGCAVTLRLTENSLKDYAIRIRDVIEAFAGESNTLMVGLKSSPSPYCSDQEIDNLRNLVFRSEYLRDIGHIRNGKIDCSATMGRLKQPIALPATEFTSPDGARAYQDLPPYVDRNQKNVGVQLGDFYVVFSHFVLSHLGSTPMHYFSVIVDSKNGHVGKLHGDLLKNVDPQQFLKDGAFRFNNSLYVTRCSVRFRNCVTSYISVPEALQAQRGQILLFTSLGGLVGVFLGIFCSIVYRSSLSMERQLHRAIRKDQLRVVYQPIVELAKGQIVEAEALVRWTDEDGFAISPEIFVRLAEERGFVGELTELVVRHTLRDFKEALRRNPEFRININVTAADLADPRFLPMLQRSLKKANVAARSVAIEVTESSTARTQVAKETIHQLRKQGHSVQIDDFGTGYSSLSYLHDLSVDAIKIDRSFTKAIGTEAVTSGILPQILAMANALNLQVIAEGIETAEQAFYFANSGMPILGQGWLFGRPVPAEIFHALLDEANVKELSVG